MVLGVLTLLYYLRVFSIIIFILIIFIFYSFFLFNKNFKLEKNLINISKGETIHQVIKNNITLFNYFDEIVFKFNYKIYILISQKIIHHGDFKIKKNISLIELLETITNPSNILDKITIIEGWSKNDLSKELGKFFNNFDTIEYNEILADTYYFEKNRDFKYFYESLKQYKKNFMDKRKNNIFFSKFNKNDILIIGSLIEKEGLDYNDKRKISSVIINRLNKNMRLQIDATVLYALTEGKHKLNRKLSLRDLKIDHPYNTYKNKGLPPKPISYVGTKTIDIILENYKSDFLFYFFNNLLNKHEFSINYNEHKNKLNEYRNKK